jgi:hypothetical protein
MGMKVPRLENDESKQQKSDRTKQKFRYQHGSEAVF